MLNTFFYILLGTLPIILNRWRGHGSIIPITTNIHLIGSLFYAIYVVVIAYLITNIELVTVFSLSEAYIKNLDINIFGLYIDRFEIKDISIIIGIKTFMLLAFIIYIQGEAYGWGKWVGYLTSDDPDVKPEYDNKTGRRFPYIHYIANFFINQTKNYDRYCQLAITIRGIVWWLPLMSFLGYISNNLLLGMILGLIIGMLFPVACYLGKISTFSINLPKLRILANYGWERQEIIYGFFQSIGFIILLLAAN